METGHAIAVKVTLG